MARRGIKILVWALATAAGLGLITAGGLLLLAGSHLARDWLLQQARQELAARAGIELSYGSVRGRLLTGLELRDLRLASGGRTFFTARRLLLRHNPLALMGGRLSISRLVLVDPSLSLPLPDLGGAGGGGPPPLALSLKRVEVVNGAIDPGGAWGPLGRLEGLALNGRMVLDARGLSARADLSAGRARIAGSPQPVKVRCSARLESGRLRLSDLRLALGPNTVRGQGVLDLHKLSLRTRLEATLADARSLPLAWPLPQAPPGPLGLTLDATGPPDALRIGLRLAAGEGSLKLSGSADLTAPAAKGELTLTDLDPARLGLAAAGRLSGSADFSADLSGPGPKADLELKLGPGRLAGVAIASLDGAAAWEAGVLNLRRLEASGPWGQARAQGSFTPPAGGRPLRMDGSMRFTRLTAPPRLAGLLPPRLRKATLSGQLSAHSRQRDVLLDLSLGPSQVSDSLALDRLRAEGVWGPGGPVLQRLEVSCPLGEITAQGRLDAAGSQLGFALKLPALQDLGPLWAMAGVQPPPGLAGSLEAEGELGGPWSKPTLKLKAKGRELAAAGMGAASLELSLAAERLGLRPLGQADLKAAGLKLGGVLMDSAQAQVELKPGAARARLSAKGPRGSVSLNLASADPPGLPLRCQLSGLSVRLPGREQWTQRKAAQLMIARDHLSLSELTLASGSQRLALLGSWRPGRVQGQLKAEALNPGPWLPPELASEPGRLNFTARLDGALAQPRFDIKGSMDGLKGAGLPPTRLSFEGRYSDGLLRLTGSSRIAGWPSLDLSARLHASISLQPPAFEPAPGGLMVKVHGGSLPLALLGPLLPGVSQVGGMAELDLTVDGDLKAPRARGSLTIADGSLTVNATGQRISEITMLLRLDGRRLRIDQASCRAGNQLSISGWLDLPLGKGGSLELHARGKGVTVGLGVLGEAGTDLDLGMTGPWSRPVIKGKLTPRRMRITPGVSPPAAMDEVVELRPGQKPPPLALPSRDLSWRPGGILGRASIDVSADLSQGLRVKVSEGFIELAGQARVTKEPGGPLIYRDVVTVRQGRLILAGRAFQLSRGRINFRGRSQPNPDIWARAVLRTGRNRITVNVAGTAEDPVLNLASEPPMSQADILSTIIFGRPAASLSNSQSQGLSAQALALLGLKGAREIEAFLGPELAPDVVTVHEDYATGSSLEAGKYLGRDLYLHYRQNLSQEGGQNLGLEYRLNRYFSLDSQVGNTRDTGVDLLFNYDFGRTTRPLLDQMEQEGGWWPLEEHKPEKGPPPPAAPGGRGGGGAAKD